MDKEKEKLEISISDKSKTVLVNPPISPSVFTLIHNDKRR